MTDNEVAIQWFMRITGCVRQEAIEAMKDRKKRFEYYNKIVLQTTVENLDCTQEEAIKGMNKSNITHLASGGEDVWPFLDNNGNPIED